MVFNVYSDSPAPLINATAVDEDRWHRQRDSRDFLWNGPDEEDASRIEDVARRLFDLGPNADVPISCREVAVELDRAQRLDSAATNQNDARIARDQIRRLYERVAQMMRPPSWSPSERRVVDPPAPREPDRPQWCELDLEPAREIAEPTIFSPQIELE